VAWPRRTPRKRCTAAFRGCSGSAASGAGAGERQATCPCAQSSVATFPSAWRSCREWWWSCPPSACARILWLRLHTQSQAQNEVAASASLFSLQPKPGTPESGSTAPLSFQKGPMRAEVAFYNSIIGRAYERGTRGRSYPGPVGAGSREDESTKSKIFCNQAQNF